MKQTLEDVSWGIMTGTMKLNDILENWEFRKNKSVADINKSIRKIKKEYAKVEYEHSMLSLYLKDILKMRRVPIKIVNVGDVVRNKDSGMYGTVHYSSFGVSIHIWDEENKALLKTIGDKADEVSKYWETVDIPEGYDLAPHGGLVKNNG